MKLNEEFLPNGGPPKLIKIWATHGVAFLITSLPNVLAPADFVDHIVVEVILLVFFAIMIIANRSPVSVTISDLDRSVIYQTMDCFGRIRQIKVYLPTAKINYKYTQLTRGRRGWRL